MDDAMTETNRPSPHIEARSVLSQVVETQLLPQERFKDGQKGEVVDIAKIGEIVATLRKLEDRHELSVWDGKGRQTVIPLDPSSEDLAKKMAYSSYLATQEKQDWSINIEGTFGELGFSPKTSRKLEQTWFQRAARHYGKGALQLYEMNQKSLLYIPAGDWKLGILFREIQGKQIPGFLYHFGAKRLGKFRIVTSSTLMVSSAVDICP